MYFYHYICVQKHFFYFQLDLKLNSEAGGDTSTFIPNGEWDLVGNEKKIWIWPYNGQKYASIKAQRWIWVQLKR